MGESKAEKARRKALAREHAEATEEATKDRERLAREFQESAKRLSKLRGQNPEGERDR